VNAVAFAGGADLLVTASDDGTAAVWDVAGHRRLPLHVLRHEGPVTDLAVARDGTTLATASADGHVRIWSLPGGRLLRTIAFPSRVDDVALDADAGRVLAVGGVHARLYSTSSGAMVGAYEHLGPVTAAAMSANGQLVVTGHPGKHPVARVWRADGTFLTALVGHQSAITDVEFAPKGLLAVTASADGEARVYNLGVRSARQFIAPLIGHTNHVLSATFSPDGTRIVTASSDKDAAVWQLEGLNLATLVGHTQSVTGAVMSADDRYVLTWSRDGTARVWDWEPDPLPPVVGSTGGHPQRAVFGDGGAVVASLDDAGVVRVTRAGSAAVVRIRHAGGATAVAVSPDGSHVATGGNDGHVLVSRAGGGVVSQLLLGRPVRAVAFSADGRRVAAAGRLGRVRVWMPDGRLLRTLETGPRTFTAVALSPDGRRVAVGAGNGLITILDTSTGKREHTLTGHRNDILALAFSPDGRLLVSGSRDADARIWSVSDGHTLHLLRRHFSQVTDVEFSPDGRWVVSTGQQRVVLWRTATGARVILLQWSPPYAFVAAGFRPNSRTILTAGADGAVRAYTCRVCGRIGELRSLAERRLRELRPLGG
jgi:WD40 repeat protein